MAYLNLENEVNGAMRMDMSLSNGAFMKATRMDPLASSTMNMSQNTSIVLVKTPSKDSNKSMNGGSNKMTPSGKRTPNSAGRKKTPGGKGCKTPSAGDRFIPNRNGTKFDLAHYKLCTQNEPTKEECALMSPSQQEYHKIMTENLNGNAMGQKILCFKERPPPAPADGCANNLRVLYSTSKMSANKRKTTRYIPQVPERILDAPDILDDYYLSLIDWSAQNVLAVALGGSVYLWDAGTGSITPLVEIDSSRDEYISCVKWTSDGFHLAVSLSSGIVELWDPVQKKKLRTMSGHSARVGSLSWNSYIVSSGSRTGSIHHHDVRVAEHHVGTLQGHTQEVCGLQWSPNGHYLASGGNDNLINIWRAGTTSLLPDTQPVYTFNQHQSAVKAMAWCPWQSNILATGGGTADRHIRTWNCNNGASLEAVDTQSQVCGLLWSEEHKELISGHGFTQNQLTLWKYPAMTKVSELTGHTARILHMCLSPDNTTVVSAGADETLRLWKCFAIDEKVQKSKSKSKPSSMEERSSFKYHMR